MANQIETDALAVFAEPIQRDARTWAAGVIDSLECDGPLCEGAPDVIASDECTRAVNSGGLRVPEAAMPWARRVWCEAFESEFSRLLTEHGVIDCPKCGGQGEIEEGYMSKCFGVRGCERCGGSDYTPDGSSRRHTRGSGMVEL